MLKPILKLDFTDFGGINKNDNNFTRILSKEYTIQITDHPDLLIFSELGHLNRLYTCRKLFWTGESILPNWNRTDYALTCHYLANEPRHRRFPYYVFGTLCQPQDLIKHPCETEQILAEQRKFCAAVVSNCSWKPWKESIRRGQLMRQLHQAQAIASGGRFMNTIGRVIPIGYNQKEDFIRQYKFCVAFENKVMDGYTTEKLTQAMWVRCVPLYWGNHRVQEDFNPKSFINHHDFPNDESFIRHILEVDRNPDLYIEYLKQPFFHQNIPNRYYDDNYLLEFIERIISDTSKPVSSRQKFYHFGRWRLAKRMHY